MRLRIIQLSLNLRSSLLLLLSTTASALFHFVIFFLRQLSKHFFIAFLVLIELKFFWSNSYKTSKNLNKSMTESIAHSLAFAEATISRVKMRSDIRNNELRMWDEHRYVESV